MYFSASSAVGLGFVAAQAAAFVLPGVDKVARADTVTVVSTASAVTVTVTTTVSALPVLNSTALANSTLSTTVSIRASATATTSLPVPTTTPISGLTADQQQALDLHNKARSDVGCGSLTWDPALAKDAQAWANNLAALGSMVHDQNTGGQGENLAYMEGGATNYYARAVQLWLDEKTLYKGQPITADGTPSYHDYGHYTQCVWKSTQKVGLALASANGKNFVVARYLPAGNYIGQMPY